jgi:hypothetical protein
VYVVVPPAVQNVEPDLGLVQIGRGPGPATNGKNSDDVAALLEGIDGS